MRFLLAIILSFSIMSLPAQLLKKLKQAASDKLNINKSDVKSAASKLVFKEMEKARAEFDSTDFDYALLLNENSNLFDIKEKGENTTRFYTLGNLGKDLYKREDFTDAENARYNLQLGEMAYAMRKFVFAEKKFNSAKNILANAGLKNDLNYAKAISSQGLLYATMGRYSQADPYTAQALELNRTQLGEKNIGVAASYNNYGVLDFNLGRYNNAEKHFDSALTVIKSNGMDTAMSFAIVLNNQAMLFQTIGRNDDAAKKLNEAVAVAEKLEGSRSRNHLKFLSNLALLYQQNGKYTEAENIYLGMEKRFGKNTPEYANLVNNKAILYLMMNKESEVADLLNQSAAIYKSNFGETSPAYAKAISDLGNFHRYKQKYSEAEPLLTQASTIREQSLGKTHPLYVQSQEDLAILYWKMNSAAKAYTLYKEVMQQSLDFITRYFPPMSEAEKTKYWDVLSQRFQRFFNFAVENASADKQLLNDMYQYRIATKGVLLNSTKKIRQNILNSQDPLLTRDYSAWIDQKEQLTKMFIYSKAELKEQGINIDSMLSAANTLEKNLSERSKLFSEGYAYAPVTLNEIKETLETNEAIVEIIRIRNYEQNFTNNSKYAVLVITKDNDIPKLVLLNNGKELETKYSKTYKLAIQSKSDDAHSYNQYWVKIDGELKDAKTVYVSADGVFHQVNLNTIKKTGGNFLIEKYDLVLVGNSKDLVRKKTATPVAIKKSVLLGFPEYGSTKITALPATKTEIESISTILKTAQYDVTLFSNASASESNLKSAKEPAVLHIATHGYFLQDVEKAQFPLGVNVENATEVPLLRSGLLLAGAGNTSKTMTNIESNDNGILTAYEAMNLDLQGTELVVLSACETGLGDVKAGEGVYGLQRAFLAGGAETIIMSLWKVNDEASQQLMTNFYSNWVKSGNKHEAFRKAQLELMTKYKAPYYWGGFVMMGN